MARTKNPNSATSQFFINTANNNFLNYGVRDEGYAVFGKVISGFEIVDEIEKVQTISKNGAQNWPVENIIIEKIELI
jgi:cyclophilin family peptidyl-prolyl cis-trans isomerase